MGVSCLHTHKTIEGADVVWIQVPTYENEELSECPFSEEELYHIAWVDTIENLSYIFESLGYDRCDKLTWKNKLYSLELDSNYEGDGILIFLESRYGDAWRDDEVRLHNLAKANHQKSYSKLVNAIIKSGLFDVMMATSRWTYSKIKSF